MKRFSFYGAVAVVAACLFMAAVSMAVQVRAQSGANQGAAGDQGDQKSNITWSGSVDSKINISIQGSHVWTHVVAGHDSNDKAFRVRQPLPASDVTVSLSRVEGRGDVHIIQQPDHDNGYTAVVRIHDRQPGSGHYRIGLTW